jgi:uncharacterized protein (DUF1810 family)
VVHLPKVAGLGRSETARFYALADLAEARAYLAHPVLGSRLAECTDAMLGHPGGSAEAILGGIDALKLRSSMTLFREAGGGPRFQACLDAFYGGEPDPGTLRLLSSAIAT